MKSTTIHLTPIPELCEEKAAKVMRWLAESEDPSKQTFAVSRVFEHGVLEENTSSFLRTILEERFGGKSDELELSPEELKQILAEACTNACRYLLTPFSFIPEYLSFDSEAVHVNIKMLARLTSFIDYPYFPEMMEEWFTAGFQNSAPENRKTDLGKFLHHVESSILKYSKPEEIGTYIKPLFEFLDSEAIDRAAVEIFLTDKEISLSSEDNRTKFTSVELSVFLHNAYLEWELPAPVSDPPIQEYSAFLQELRDVGVVLPLPHHHVSPEEKRLLPSLELFISSKLRKKCLEKIFHHNESEYQRAISLLNAIEDFSQAELNLNTMLQIHRVPQDSKVAARLLDALRLRFGIPTLINSEQ